MKNNDFMPEDTEDCSEAGFTRACTVARNMESLHLLARSIFNSYARGNTWSEPLLLEINKQKTVLEQIGLVISKTYAHRGDRYQLADDKALMQIRDLLLNHYPLSLIHNEKERWRWLRKYLRHLKKARKAREEQSSGDKS